MVLVSIVNERGELLVSFHTDSSLGYRSGDIIFLQVKNRAPSLHQDVKDLERTKFQIQSVEHEVGKVYTGSIERPTMEALSMKVTVKRVLSSAYNFAIEGAYKKVEA